jgi:hypothetical protein
MLAYEPTPDEITQRLTSADLAFDTPADIERARALAVAEYHESAASGSSDDLTRALHVELAADYRAIVARCDAWVAFLAGSGDS